MGTATDELQKRMAEQMKYVLSQTPEALAAENAKLWELVKEMRVCLEDECKRCHEWGDACDLEHQMRELGVEVRWATA